MKKPFYLILLILAALVLSNTWLHAGTLFQQVGVSSSPNPVGSGARAMGMGNGYTALAEDATAVYYNPAALPYLNSQQISFLHTILFEGTIYDFASYVYPHTGIGGFGMAAMRIGTDDIGHYHQHRLDHAHWQHRDHGHLPAQRYRGHPGHAAGRSTDRKRA